MIDGDRITSPTFHGWDAREFLQAVDCLLSKGDRVEIIPVKDGMKVVKVKRETIKETKRATPSIPDWYLESDFEPAFKHFEDM